MPKDFLVIRADHKEDWTGNYGPMKTYALELQDASQPTAPTTQVEMNQKPTTAPPQPGETLYGDITPNKNPDFPAKFKKASKDGDFQGGGGGGSKSGAGTFKPRDPSEIAGARHAHNLLVAAHSFDPIPNGLDASAFTSAVNNRLENLEAFACVLDEKTAAISDAAKARPAVEKKDDSLPF